MELNNKQERAILSALYQYRNMYCEMLKDVDDHDFLFDSFLEHISMLDDLIKLLNDSIDRFYVL